MKFDLKPVPKARNLSAIAWKDGYMLATFRGHLDLYIYGPDIPQAEYDKVMRNPYPDRIFTTCIKNKFKCHKVGDGKSP